MIFDSITKAIDWFKHSMASVKNESEFSQVLLDGIRNKCVKVDETLEALKRIPSAQIDSRQREVTRNHNANRNYGGPVYQRSQLQVNTSPFEEALSQSQQTLHDLMSSVL